jgi:exonuclease SbcD
LADTHLGFDLPARPRVERRRRGHEFFANFELALQAALDNRVDILVHGGDLFYRRRIPANLVQRAFLPLKRVAEAGIPVFVVPGNHERSEIPYSMLALHPGIRIFDRPRTFTADVGGVTVSLAGFPFRRGPIRDEFRKVLNATGWSDVTADARLLCLHQSLEGATVGPVDYTFRHASDVAQIRDVPSDFAAVLAGHIHRHQVLEVDLRGRPAPAPILYSGSIERTSFAERNEPKGYMILEVEPDASTGGRLIEWRFLHLPARPMLIDDLYVEIDATDRLQQQIRRVIGAAPADAVLRLRVHGRPDPIARGLLSAPSVRSLAPPTMNVEVQFVDEARRAARVSVTLPD